MYMLFVSFFHPHSFPSWFRSWGGVPWYFAWQASGSSVVPLSTFEKNSEGGWRFCVWATGLPTKLLFSCSSTGPVLVSAVIFFRFF